jgi:hypothetical protein
MPKKYKGRRGPNGSVHPYFQSKSEESLRKRTDRLTVKVVSFSPNYSIVERRPVQPVQANTHKPVK